MSGFFNLLGGLVVALLISFTITFVWLRLEDYAARLDSLESKILVLEEGSGE